MCIRDRYTAPSDEALRRDIEQAKALGFNMLRKHIKVEPARWYYHCDTMGMLVWQDMPSGAAYPGDLLAVALPNIGVQVSDKKHKRFKRENTAARLQFTKELKEIDVYKRQVLRRRARRCCARHGFRCCCMHLLYCCWETQNAWRPK